MARKKVEDKKRAAAKAALAHAEKVNDGSKFLTSCEEFFEANGYLTVKQIAALHAIKPYGYNYGGYHDCEGIGCYCEQDELTFDDVC